MMPHVFANSREFPIRAAGVTRPATESQRLSQLTDPQVLKIAEPFAGSIYFWKK